MARGKSEVYLKDQAALDDYLVEQGAEGGVLKLGSGGEIGGQDLIRVVDEARSTRTILNAFQTTYPRFVLEQMAIEGAVHPSPAAETVAAVAARLDALAPETERGWSGEVTADGGVRFMRTVRGVAEVRTIDGMALRSAEARRLASLGPALAETYGAPAILIRKDKETQIHAPSALLDVIMAEGEKGITLQRYKGLGEMNAEQLWETTLDPEARTLLQVRIDHMAEADEIFTKLMGDVVGTAPPVHPGKRAERREPGHLRYDARYLAHRMQGSGTLDENAGGRPWHEGQVGSQSG